MLDGETQSIRRKNVGTNDEIGCLCYHYADRTLDNHDIVGQYHVFAEMVKLARRHKPDGVVLGGCSENISFAKFDAARFLLENVPSLKAVFMFSLQRLSLGFDESGVYDLVIFKIEKGHFSFVGRRDGILGQIVWGSILNQVRTDLPIKRSQVA